MKLFKAFKPTTLLAALIVLLGVGISSGLLGLNWNRFNFLGKFKSELPKEETIKVVKEESVVIDVVDKVSASVVTVVISKTKGLGQSLQIDPFDPFSFFSQPQTQQKKIEQDIGTGFIISKDGMIVTNKHVVSDTEAKYKVITKDDKTYEIKQIYRDPVNDLAILKIDSSLPAGGSGQIFKPVEFGDSSKLKVGQFVIAIGTALGEFRNTVTTGVISGLGRGITAGSPFEGYVERLDNVIQTDAAINPGNSGGPLLNSAGQVIGVNVAVAQGSQNIGFAIPINLIKESYDNFNKTGKFSRPYLGIRYKMIGKDLAILNEVPEGAYVQEVVNLSPAEKAKVLAGDIITKIDGQKVTEEDQDLAKIISSKKVGETIELTVWRGGKEIKIKTTLQEFSQ